MAARQRALFLVSIPIGLAAITQVAGNGHDSRPRAAPVSDRTLGRVRGGNTAYLGAGGDWYCGCIIATAAGDPCDCDNVPAGTDCDLCDGTAGLSGTATPPGEQGSFIEPAGGSANCDTLAYWEGQCNGAGVCVGVVNPHLPCWSTYPLFTSETQ